MADDIRVGDWVTWGSKELAFQVKFIEEDELYFED